ncbi:MAG: hypothetical protein JWP85_1603 [Rhodoglobus sp.]|nr:hypothetical protein [Rhodoglobus sp.]
MRRAVFLLVIAASVTGALAVGATAFAVAIIPVDVQGVVQDVAPIVVPRDSPVSGGDVTDPESPADSTPPQGPESAPAPATPPATDAPEVVVPFGAEELPPVDDGTGEGTGNGDGNNGAGVGNGSGNGTGNEGNGVGPGNDNGGGNDTHGSDDVEGDE